VTPEERARAIVAYFPAIPERIRGDVESVIARAIKRALNEQLAQLEQRAEQSIDYAHGRGKSGKGRNDAALHAHSQWADRFKKMRSA
jgi:hypothetical protein